MTKHYSSSLAINQPKSINLTPDENQHYVVDSKELMQGNILLMDGDDRIAEVSCHDGHLVVKISASHQLDVANSLDLKTLRLESAGNLHFKGKINAAGMNIISAGDVTFDDKLNVGYLHCSGNSIQMNATVKFLEDVQLTASETVSIKAGMNTKEEVVISSKNLDLSGSFVAETIKATVKEVISNTANIRTTKQLSMEANEIEHDGKILSYGNCEIQANEEIYCGETSSIEVKKSVNTKEKTSGFVLKTNNCTLNGYVNVLHASHIEAERLDTNNRIHLEGSVKLDVENWHCFENSDVDIHHVDHSTESYVNVTKAFWSKANSQMKMHVSEVCLKRLAEQKSENFPIHFYSKEIESKGDMNLQYTSLEGESLVVGNVCEARMDFSSLGIDNILVDGKMTCNHAELNASRISHAEKSKTEYHYTDIHAKSYFLSRNNCLFHESKIAANNVELSGELDINNLEIEGKKVIIAARLLVKGENITVKSECLELKPETNREYQINSLTANTSILETWGNILLANSTVVINDEEVSRNYGNLKLVNSFVNTEGLLRTMKDSTLTAIQEKKSGNDTRKSITAKHFYSQGNVHLAGADLSAETIVHTGKKFRASNTSSIQPKKSFFLDLQSKLTLKKNSKLEGNNASILADKASIKVKSHSNMECHDLYTLPGSDLKMSESSTTINNKALLQGNGEIVKGSGLKTKELQLFGELNIDSAATFESEKADITGKLNAKKTRLNMKESLLVRTDGKVHLEDSRIRTSAMEHQGYLHVKSNQQQGAAQEKENKTKDTEKPTFREAATLSMDKFVTSPFSRIEGDNLDIFVNDSWRHDGSINLSQGLRAKGGMFECSGNITTGEKIDLGFDSIFNSGYLSTRQLDIKAGLSVNFFGVMHADTLNNSSLLNLNAGITSAYYTQNNSILSFNLGLALPSISNPAELFSWNTLKSTAKMAVCAFVPPMSNAINFAAAIPGAYSSMKKIWDNKNQYTFSNLGKMHVHEVADHACQINKAVTSAVNLYGQAKSIKTQWDQYTDYPEKNDIRKSGNTENAENTEAQPELVENTPEVAWDTLSLFEKIITDIDLGSTLLSLGKLVGPSYNSQSFGNYNKGLVFSNNISGTHYYSNNSGYETALDSINQNAIHEYNAGKMLSGYGACNLTGYSFTNDGVVSANHGDVNVRHNKVSLSAQSQKDYERWKVKSDVFSVAGSHSFSESSVVTNEFNTHKVLNDEIEFTQKSKVFAKTSHVTLDVLFDESDFNTEVLNQNNNKITMENNSHLVVHKEHNLSKHSELDVKGHSAAVISNQTLKDNSTVTVMDHSQHIVKETWDIEKDAAVRAKNNSKILGDALNLSGKVQVQGGSSINLNGHNNVMKDGKLVIEDHSFGDIKSQTVQDGGNVNVHNNSQNIVREKLTIERGGKMIASDHSRLLLNDLDQSDGIIIKDASICSVAGHQHLKDGAVFTVENESIAVIQSQKLDDGSKVDVVNLSVQKVDGEWTISEGAECIARGTEEQQNAIAEQLQKLESLTEQACVVDAQLKETKFNHMMENAKKEQHITEIDSTILLIQEKLEKNKKNQEAEKSKKIDGHEKRKKHDESLQRLEIQAEEMRKKIAELQQQSTASKTKLQQQQELQVKETQIQQKEIDKILEQAASVSEELSQVNSQLIGKKWNLDGKVTLEDGAFLTLTEPCKINQPGELSAINNSSANMYSLFSDGKTRLENSFFNFEKSLIFSEKAKNNVMNGGYKADNIQDMSELNYSGYCNFFADNHYEHIGTINSKHDDNHNLFHVKSNTGELKGSANIDYGIFEIDHLIGDRNAFALGKGNFSNYHFDKSLSFVIKDDFHLHGNNYRTCDLHLEGTHIDSYVKFEGDYSLGLKSSVGDLVLHNIIKLENLSVDAAQSLYNYALIDNKHNVTMLARGINGGGNLYNMGGRINGYNVMLQGHNVKNITRNSEFAKQHKWHAEIGGEGIINGKFHALLQSTQGNIENHGGIIRANDFCQLISSQDIFNICNEMTYRGKYDDKKKYDPAVISGGAGGSSNGMGLYMHADGRIVNDASEISSKGTNYISGNFGVDFLARHHTYILDDYVDRGFMGFSKTHIIKTAAQVQGSTVFSETGRNIIRSESGAVNATATQFISAGGSDIYADQPIKLFDLKTTTRNYESSSFFWGLWSDEEWRKHQNVTPTIIADNGSTRIHSRHGSVEIRGAIFLGDGSLTIMAKDDIYFSRQILDNSIHQKSRSFSASFCGLNAFNILNNGGNAWQAMTSEDTTLNKLNSMGNSNSKTELVVNAWNLGIDSFNTANNLFKSFNDSCLDAAILERYGLGDANGFNPSFTLSYNWSDTKINYQTLGPGGIDRTDVILDAGNKIILENGYGIHARGDAYISATELEMRAAALASSTKTTSNSVSMGANASGNVVSGGASHSHSTSKSTTHVNASIEVGGHLHADLKKTTMTGAKIAADTASGHLGDIDATCLQDTSKSSSMSASANSAGMVSYNENHHESAKVNEATGIDIRQGINHEGKTLTANVVNLHSAKITSDGPINDFSDEINATDIKDYEKNNGIGMQTNLNHLSRFTQDKKSAQDKSYSEQAIATVGITHTKTDFKAVQRSTIYGAGGTFFDRSKVQGNLNTENADGYKVTRNKVENIHVDIPITNTNYLNAAKENIVESISNLMPVLPDYQHFAQQENPVLESAAIVLKPVSVELIYDDAPVQTINETFRQDNPDFVKNNIEKVTINNNISLVDSDPASERAKIIETGFDPDTFDVRIGFKNGPHGRSNPYDIADGQLVNDERVAQKITDQNEEHDMMSHETRVSYKKEFIDSEQKIYWQYGDEGDLIRPTLVDDNGYGYFIAEYDPSCNLVQVQLNAGRTLRLNLAQGECNLGDLVTVQFAVDAASVYSTLGLTISNERGLNAEGKVELGILGPNAGVKASSPEICFFGFTFQCDVSAKAGVGAKIAAGGGCTLDTTQLRLRPYIEVGGYAGCGAETEVRFNLGIDTEGRDQVIQVTEELLNSSMYGNALTKVQECIEKAERENPATFFGKWNQQVRLQSLREAENDIRQYIADIAGSERLFAIRKPPSIEQDQNSPVRKMSK